MNAINTEKQTKDLVSIFIKYLRILFVKVYVQFSNENHLLLNGLFFSDMHFKQVLRSPY
jgi:hypothetical protein